MTWLTRTSGSGDAPNGPLDLPIGERRLRFSTLTDLDFTLAPRTMMTAARMQTLRPVTVNALELAHEALAAADARIATALVAHQSAPVPWLDAGEQTCPRLFASDHDWRELIEAAVELAPRHAAFRDLLLLRYLEYLRSCRHTLESIIAQSRKSAILRREPAGALETLVNYPAVAAQNVAFAKAPRGRPVHRRLRRGDSLALRFGVDPFLLEFSGSWQLRDGLGTRYPLTTGQCMVGRHPRNDIVIDPRYRGVSRRHAIFELDARNNLRITDLSAIGTFIPNGTFV